MPLYDDAVIADSPVVFVLHDEEGFATSGEELEDRSGNSKPFTLCHTNPSGTFQPYGHASGIETDPLSRAFRAHMTGSFFGEDYAAAHRDGDSDLNVTGDFTLECFFKLVDPDADAVVAVWGKFNQYRLQLYPGASVGGSALVRFSLKVWLSDGSEHEVTAENFYPFLGTSYHVVGGRSGNALFLRVNYEHLVTATVPALANAPAPTGATLGPCSWPRDSMIVGAVGGEVTGDIQKCAFYDHALSASRVQAHYNAARLYRDMRGVCNVVTSATLDGDLEPDPLVLPFRHDWGAPLVERLSARSSVFHSRDRTPELSRQRTAPRREVEYSLAVKTEAERRLFRALVWDAQGRKWFAGMWQDKVRVASQASGTDTFSLDTEFRDYDTHFLVWESESKNEVIEIDSLTTGSLTGVSGLSQDYTRPFVMPARRALLPARIDERAPTRGFSRAGIVARLLAEDEPLAPNRVTPWTPTLTWSGFEVFDPAEWERNDYSEPVEIEHAREVDLTDFSTGVFSERSPARGGEPARTYRMLLVGREKISKFLGWWYYRQGRAVPFWMPSFEADFVPSAAGSLSATVEGHAYTDYYEGTPNRDRLVFVYKNNSIAYRQITAAAPSGANDALTLSGGAGTMTLTNLRFACFLKLGHMDADTLELAWKSDETVRVTWRFRELLAAP